MAQIISYRVLSNFDANNGATHVEGRVHFEHAASAEEAAEKTTEYLKSWGYTNIKITESRPETNAEKYGKRFAHWDNGDFSLPVVTPDSEMLGNIEKTPAATHADDDGVAQVLAAPAQQKTPAAKVEFTDDLF